MQVGIQIWFPVLGFLPLRAGRMKQSLDQVGSTGWGTCVGLGCFSEELSVTALSEEGLLGWSSVKERSQMLVRILGWYFFQSIKKARDELWRVGVFRVNEIPGIPGICLVGSYLKKRKLNLWVCLRAIQPSPGRCQGSGSPDKVREREALMVKGIFPCTKVRGAIQSW